MSWPNVQRVVHNFTNMSGSNRNQTRQTFLLYYFYSFMFGCLPVFDSWPVLNPAYLEYHSTHTWSISATTNWVLVVFLWLSRFFCVVRRYLFGNVLLDCCFPSAVGLPKYSQRSGIHRYPILLRSYLHLQFGCGEYNYMTTSTGGSLPEISWATLLMLTSESCLHPGSTMFDHHVVGKLLVAPWLPMNCRKVE